ncbi:peptidoglycan-associated lipoprotein OprL [Marinomonas sp. MED121]|jgi:peptidoglycan-associated lipoprotein|uniref:peptidoglycan-associated lipoprotein Pal n=1 Tax=Marinomonas sp. MED121 TaxID=314277 RepID=UPI000068FE6B|nr:peptidoglycan-associated lipoprotein Pal [Marinomonas sp. MED121]EAQ66609.1 peptidoglycan-associated lipoprotein OprL [Marinomonas sp. MED121]
MSVNKLGKMAVIGLSAAWIAGCSTTATETDSSSVTEAEGNTVAAQSSAANSTGSSDGSFGANGNGDLSSVIVDGNGNVVSAENATAAQKAAANAKDMLVGVAHIFYFDFDKSIVRPEAREALAKHAKFLVANPDARVVLEGHADERGTREYNMALGERRAKAVSRYLTIQGVAAAQIESVSFGEEKPLEFGHDKAAWQANRRVEVRYE